MKNYSTLMAEANAIYEKATENTTFDATKKVFVYEFDNQPDPNFGDFYAENGWDEEYDYENACNDAINTREGFTLNLIGTIADNGTVRCFVYHGELRGKDFLNLVIMFNDQWWG